MLVFSVAKLQWNHKWWVPQRILLVQMIGGYSGGYSGGCLIIIIINTIDKNTINYYQYYQYNQFFIHSEPPI